MTAPDVESGTPGARPVRQLGESLETRGSTGVVGAR
jgi:hypothetical protein